MHSEDDGIIKNNTHFYREKFGETIPFEFHPKIRSEEACVAATKRVLEIAKKQAPAMPKKSMTLTHIGLFVGGLAVGYFVYKKFKK